MAGSASGTTPLRMIRNCSTTLPRSPRRADSGMTAIPVALHTGKHAGQVVAEVHALGGREHFQAPAQVSLAPSAASAADSSTAAGHRPSELGARRAAILQRFLHGLPASALPGEKRGSDEAGASVYRRSGCGALDAGCPAGCAA